VSRYRDERRDKNRRRQWQDRDDEPRTRERETPRHPFGERSGPPRQRPERPAREPEAATAGGGKDEGMVKVSCYLRMADNPKSRKLVLWNGRDKAPNPTTGEVDEAWMWVFRDDIRIIQHKGGRHDLAVVAVPKQIAEKFDRVGT
jgi:hypothetical protein